MQSPLDARFYYLSNFQQALTWLQERSGDLLSESEHGFLQRFCLRLPAYSASAKVIFFIGKLSGWNPGILPKSGSLLQSFPKGQFNGSDLGLAFFALGVKWHQLKRSLGP